MLKLYYILAYLARVKGDSARVDDSMQLIHCRLQCLVAGSCDRHHATSTTLPYLLLVLFDMMIAS